MLDLELVGVLGCLLGLVLLGLVLVEELVGLLEMVSAGPLVEPLEMVLEPQSVDLLVDL